MSERPELRLILPHQLCAEHLAAAGSPRMVLIEHDLFFRQYRFLAQKLVLHRASMDRFAERLRRAGHRVDVLRSDPQRSSREQLASLVLRLRPARVTWFDVVDDWLEQDLRHALADGGYDPQPDDERETPNFLTDRARLDSWSDRPPARLHEFYVWQRRRLGLLLDADGEPLGGRWSFDADNRKKYPRSATPPTVGIFADHPVLPTDNALDLDSLMSDPAAGHRDPEEHGVDDGEEAGAEAVAAAISWVAREFPAAPGDPHQFVWPTSHAEARAHLQEFVTERLADFGPYEDAISGAHPFLHHGLLTASLNIGLLDPREILDAVLESRGDPVGPGGSDGVPLASLEGFVRQVVGWREYMRAVYRRRSRHLRTANHLGHHHALGEGWWDGTTGLEPVDRVIRSVLATGYAHHIERLMILGSAMSLLRIHPDRAYEWFMEMFIDAYDWVMVPNVYAMSQFAAAAEVTTKPYVSGSNYLRKLSDLPEGEWTQDWDALYWAFVEDHRAVLEHNHRARMMVAQLDRRDAGTRRIQRDRADAILGGAAHPRLVAG